MTEAELAVGSEVLDVVPGVDRSQMASDYLGSLSVPAILGEPHDSVENLVFDRAHVFSIDSGNASGQRTFELRFNGEPLVGERFLSLLQAVAPQPTRMNDPSAEAEGILGDWVIYESKNSEFERLAQAHSRLKGWAELGLEYPDLKTALGPADSFQLVSWMMPGNEDIIKPAEFIYDWGDAEILASHEPLISGSDFTQLLVEAYGEDEGHRRIIKSMRDIKPEDAETEGLDLKGLNDADLLKVFSELGIETRNRLVWAYRLQMTNGSPTEETEKFKELYLKRHCVAFETEDGLLMYAHGVSPGFDITRAYDDRQRVYFGNNRPFMHKRDYGLPFDYEAMEIDTLIGKQTAIIPDSVRFYEQGLVPTVRWRTDAEGNREQQSLPEHEPLTHPKQNVLSNAAGLMVLAYLQPKRRAHWRKEARLPGIQAVQEMGPAQVPLIAIQQSTRLLDNDLMREAEGLV